MISFDDEKNEVQKYVSQIEEIVVLMKSLERLYSKGTSRLLRSRIRKLKQSIVDVQKSCLQKDKEYIESLPPEERFKKGRKKGQKNGFANPKE
jgi:hypothetical protein